MNRKSIGLGAVLLLSVGLTGCRASYDADLSPDGTTVAQMTSQGLTLRSLDPQVQDRFLNGKALSGPRFSPDGKTLVANDNQTGRLILVDAKSGKSKDYAVKLAPPFAWRPDGTEVIGWASEKRADVFHVKTGQVVRSYALERPDSLKWLPQGRDLALAYHDRVALLRNGKATTVPAELARVGTVGADAGHVVWVEHEGIEARDEIPTGRMIVRQMDLRDLHVSTVRDIADMAKLVKGEEVLLPGAVSLSPDGERVALSAIVVKNPRDVWDDYLSLLKKRPKGLTQADRETMKRIEKRLRFEGVAVLLPFSGGEATVVAKIDNFKQIYDLPTGFEWSTDGSKLALVFNDRTKVVDVPH